ncbi:unnamed protein product [Ceratitis capitata]|uniref:(Mediterranean fruit fly) hypothetical protein n=1 Tax=Ceratitis capitata TaxID=7213 RepID=A0A811VEC8_CERCA|nr:unnamed protein product [Ceratitis capitata]
MPDQAPIQRTAVHYAINVDHFILRLLTAHRADMTCESATSKHLFRISWRMRTSGYLPSVVAVLPRCTEDRRENQYVQARKPPQHHYAAFIAVCCGNMMA